MSEVHGSRDEIIGRIRNAEVAWARQRHVWLWGGVVALVASLWILVSVLVAARTSPVDSAFRAIAVPVVVPLLLTCAVAAMCGIRRALVYWSGDPVRALLLSMADEMGGKAS